MRTFVIGDIHGCFQELNDLVLALDAQPGDRFVFVGDLVDKGPSSVEVLIHVQELIRKFPGSLCVAGNHEEMAIHAVRKGKLKDWMGPSFSAGDLQFLERMPLAARLDWIGNDLVVHAGVYPEYFAKHGPIPPGAMPYGPDWHKGGGKLMDRARRFLRVRYVDANGAMVGLHDTKPEHKHWTEVYDGREGRVFFGHDPQLSGQPLVTPYAIGLDTACVFGGRLTAAVMETGPGTRGRVDFVSVPARQKYCEPLILAGE